MNTINYNNQKVYTHSTRDTTPSDLAKSTPTDGEIRGAYFFTVDGNQNIHRTEFNKNKVRANTSGLMVDVKFDELLNASVAIAGLERITSFLCDTGALGNVSILPGVKGRKCFNGF